MLADGGDALGKEAKNWLKRPVGREIKVTSGTGDGGVHFVGVSPPEGPYGQTASRMQGTWAVWPSSLLQAAHREPPCETGQEHGGVRSRRDSGSLAQKLGASVRRRDPAWVGGGWSTLGSRRKGTALLTVALYRPSAVISKSPKNVCANPRATDFPPSPLGNDITGVSVASMSLFLPMWVFSLSVKQYKTSYPPTESDPVKTR